MFPTILKSFLQFLVIASFFPLISYADKLPEGLDDLPQGEQADSLLRLSEYYSYDQPDTAIYFAELAAGIQEEYAGEVPALTYKLLADAYYYKNDFESAISYYQRSAEIEEDLNGSFSDPYALRLNDVGYCYYVIGIYDLAIKYYQQALAIFDQSGNTAELYATLNNIGSVYFKWGKYEQAIEYFLQTLRFDEEENNDENLAMTNNNIGKVYHAWHKYDLAISYLNTALEYARKTQNSNNQAVKLSNLGMVYLETGNASKAMELLQEALALDEAAGRQYKVAIRKNEISRILASEEKYDEAIAYCLEAIDFFEKANIVESLIIARKDLGYYYAASGKFEKAEQAYLQAISIGEEIGSDYTLIASYQGLSSLYKDWGLFEKAWKYRNKYDEANQRVFNAEKHKQLANYEIKYRTRETQIENELLKNENRLKQNRLTFVLLAAGSLLFIIVLLIYGIRLKNKTLKQQKELAAHELSEKEKEKQHFEDKVFAEQQINRLQQEQFEQNIEYKNHLLANSILGLVQKNEFLIDLKEKFTQSGEENGISKKDIISLINQNIDLDQDWNKFKLEFSEIHPGFFDKLMADYPDLSETYVQLCAYLRIDLPSKEIAQLQHISMSAVNKNRQRLRKKLGLEAEADLSGFLKRLV